MNGQLVSDDDYIILGKINAHQGVKGWLKVYSYTEPKQNILSYQHIFLLRNFDSNGLSATATVKISDNIWKQVEIDDGRLQGKGVIVHIKGYDNRESAEELIGSTIAIARAQLEELAEDEYYWLDLIGLEVTNQEGINLGQVVKILPTGANDVLVIKQIVRPTVKQTVIQNDQHKFENKAIVDGLQKEYLIPYVFGQFVLNIDLEAGNMQVDWDIDF